MLFDCSVCLWDGGIEAKIDKAFRGNLPGRDCDAADRNDCGERGKTASDLSRATRRMPGMARLICRLSLACQILQVTRRSEPYVR